MLSRARWLHFDIAEEGVKGLTRHVQWDRVCTQKRLIGIWDAHFPEKMNSNISERVIQVSGVSQGLQAAEHEVLQAKNSCCSNLYLRAFLLLNVC